MAACNQPASLRSLRSLQLQPRFGRMGKPLWGVIGCALHHRASSVPEAAKWFAVSNRKGAPQ